jgi:hypothetical protein
MKTSKKQEERTPKSNSFDFAILIIFGQNLCIHVTN